MTAIVATIGPDNSSPSTLKAMQDAGVTMWRLNGAHGTFDWHTAIVDRLRDLYGQTTLLGNPLIMMDIPGRKRRDFKTPCPEEVFRLAYKLGIQYVASPFCHDVQDVLQWSRKTMGVIAKIEDQQGLNNIDAIAAVCDILWLDRGDMADSIGIGNVPAAQDAVLFAGAKARKPTYIATGVLGSMEHQEKPSLSDMMDAAQIVKAGAAGIVLAEETARGKYPVTVISRLKGVIDAYST